MPHKSTMSKRTTIYVLFKEYPDPNGRAKSVPYIQDSAEYLDQPDALMEDWTEVFDVLSFFGYEQTNKYYDEQNLQGLIYVAEICPDEYPMQYETILSEIQAVGLTSWQSDACEKTETYYFGQDEVTNHLLVDMAQRNGADNPCVLLQKGAIVIPHGGLQIKTSTDTLMLATADNVKSMHQWISDHRVPERNYVFNPKHGDACHPAQAHTDRRHGSIPSAQLLTDALRTQELLNKAVGDTWEGDLWFYDDSNGCYIYFENQGDTPQHEYHAYHLHPGEKNYDKIDVEKLRKVQGEVR